MKPIFYGFWPAPLRSALNWPISLGKRPRKDGIEILTLDWTGDPPLLAVVLARAGTPVIDKIVTLSGKIEKNELEEIFVEIPRGRKDLRLKQIRY